MLKKESVVLWTKPMQLSLLVIALYAYTEFQMFKLSASFLSRCDEQVDTC
jgi:hypothetical protein